MGIDWAPVYNKALGSAIEDTEKAIAKIKTNKYTKKDLLALVKFAAKLSTAALEEFENEK